MIGMIRRILGISGKYKGRIYGAFVLSFLKGMLMKVPIIVMYFIAAAFIDGNISKRACIYAAVALVASVGVQALFQYLADRLQSAAGYMIFADMRMKLGEHLRRLPMGFFTEGIGIIKTYNLLGERSKELIDSFDTNCRVNLGFEEAHMPWKTSVYIVYGLATAAVLAVSAVMYRNGTLPLNYFIGMLLFLFDMFVPIRTFYDQGTRLTVMNACMDRIDALFAGNELDDSGTQTLAENDSPEIEYRNVTFAYDKKDVLKDVSFSAEKGTMTALVGPSGGGKSTIASLFARFWDIQSGAILLRGTDIRKLPLSVLMDNISMVFQRVYLFQDTVYNNIALGRTDASREEVIEAAKKARCYDFITELPDGFDTVIGEGGASLSGGQAQRLSIARCILKDSPIVILDEATASVDADNESYIQQAISELCKGKTLLVIAHRLNTIAHADRIMVVKDGQIAESGDHSSLMAKDGIYRSMVTKRAVSTGWRN
ncbi:ABC transporter ATP-binding protein [Ruminococcus flavefaciens]|uniref:ABC transporter ATP-binding protein n=1 Tax=Ruminococcus flavefaciens TaxID=1265 RepID=UPI00156642E7|nr:ABC transporter ATP-binding protein [Ruminococcus flavefaciens]